MNTYKEATVTPEKLTHMTHIEELPLFGKDALRLAVKTLQDVYAALRGDSTSSRITLKWDGCISPETPVMTKEGMRPIIEVITQVINGEYVEVKGYSHEDLQDSFTRVTNAKKDPGEKNWVTVVLEDGREFSCTEDHEIYTLNRGYIPAAELTLFDELKED